MKVGVSTYSSVRTVNDIRLSLNSYYASLIYISPSLGHCMQEEWRR